jgi:hypothetical protein
MKKANGNRLIASRQRARRVACGLRYRTQTTNPHRLNSSKIRKLFSLLLVLRVALSAPPETIIKTKAVFYVLLYIKFVLKLK